MKKAGTSKGPPKEQDSSVSEISALKKKEHPQVQAYILALEKEVGHLQSVLAKQEVAHLSAFQKLKSEFETQKKDAAHLTVQFVSPNNRQEKET